MAAIWKLRKVTIPTTLVTIIFTLLSSAPPSSANEFQMEAAINHDNNEVVDEAGWSTVATLAASDADGMQVNILNGQSYHLEISGTFVYAKNRTVNGKPRIADAECSIDPEGQPETAYQWKTERWQGWGTDLLDVLVTNWGSSVPFNWIPESPYPPLSLGGEPQCSSVNRYYADVAASAWYLTFKVDDRYWLDNIGDLQIKVSRSAFTAPRMYEGKGYQCPKWTHEKEQLDPIARIGGIEHAGMMLDSQRDPNKYIDPSAKDALGNHIIDFNQESGHWGMYTCNWSLPDSSYRIVVDGVWKWEHDDGTLALADAECATGSVNYENKWAPLRTDTRSIDTWMDQRYVDNRKTASTADDIDYLDLFINRFKNLDWTPMYPDPQNPKCAGDADHTYFLDNWVPDRTGPIMFEVGDWEYAEQDNRGMLCIHVEKVGASAANHDAPANTQPHDILTVSDFTKSLGG